jgi:predicted nucleic acid-binding protein
MKLRIYLDTSVFSALYDERAPDRKSLTQEFWRGIESFLCSASELTVAEIKDTPDPGLRARMEGLLAGFQIHPISDEMRTLAESYIRAGAFTRAMVDDAIHVAAATVTRQDILLSWNFRHLVNRRRRAIVNGVNMNLGMPAIDILSPPEV